MSLSILFLSANLAMHLPPKKNAGLPQPQSRPLVPLVCPELEQQAADSRLSEKEALLVENYKQHFKLMKLRLKAYSISVQNSRVSESQAGQAAVRPCTETAPQANLEFKEKYLPPNKENLAPLHLNSRVLFRSSSKNKADLEDQNLISFRAPEQQAAENPNPKPIGSRGKKPRSPMPGPARRPLAEIDATRNKKSPGDAHSRLSPKSSSCFRGKFPAQTIRASPKEAVPASSSDRLCMPMQFPATVCLKSSIHRCIDYHFMSLSGSNIQSLQCVNTERVPVSESDASNLDLKWQAAFGSRKPSRDLGEPKPATPAPGSNPRPKSQERSARFHSQLKPNTADQPSKQQASTPKPGQSRHTSHSRSMQRSKLHSSSQTHSPMRDAQLSTTALIRRETKQRWDQLPEVKEREKERLFKLGVYERVRKKKEFDLVASVDPEAAARDGQETVQVQAQSSPDPLALTPLTT